MNMECASHEISSSVENTNLVGVESVVQSWMIDYYFATLCRHFKARSAPEFHKALKIFEGNVFSFFSLGFLMFNANLDAFIV